MTAIFVGNPRYNQHTPANYPNAYSVNAAVCANESVVHYANHHMPEVSGIIKFMSSCIRSTLNFTNVPCRQHDLA